MLWKSRSPRSYSEEPGLPIVSTLPMWTGSFPLTWLCRKLGAADDAFVVWAKSSAHVESGAVKSGEREPYHDTARRAGSPATSEGMTFERRPPESTRTGLLQC